MSPFQERSAAWRQFLLAKRAMLAAYDRALAHAKTQTVQVHHGNVGEAAVRDWLASFLPKRFGVTPGYVRSQGVPESHQTAHFDVIIYDQLEAPILWVEENPDKSPSGLARIVPAEHVGAVLEVKARFNRRSVDDALSKLRELDPLSLAYDSPEEPYPRYLRPNAVLGTLFFELDAEEAGDLSLLERFRSVEFARPFYGGVILRGAGHPVDSTASIRGTVSTTPISELFLPEGLLHNTALTASVEVNGEYRGAMLMWSALNFSQFAFDILAFLNGSYRSGRTSSFHGLDFKALEADAG
jgi:hypothetical protein